jgi:hypothetical protein
MMQSYTDIEPKHWEIRSSTESRCDMITEPFLVLLPITPLIDEEKIPTPIKY